MLNLKKVIALVCVFALALTTVAFGATYSDVAEDSAYYEAVETLNKLDIITGYEDGTFKPEAGVTRAEMAALIARIQGYGETAKASANTGFADVPASHWASGYIANAAGMGIINGYGNGNFGPEDPVLYEQAIKMVMATLGYTPYAEKNGGYPTGYLAAAQRYDVSLAVANAAVGQAANRGTVAQILENAIDTPLMIQSSWNTNGEVVYVIADGTTQGNYTTHYKTLMSENLGYVKIRGIVTANQTTIIGDDQEINTNDVETVTIAVADDYDTENKVFLNRASDKFLVNGTDAADYIGRSVIAYLKVNSKDNLELLSVAVDTARNEELVIDVDQFVGHVAGEPNKVEYLKDGANKTTVITIAQDDTYTVGSDTFYRDYDMQVIYNFDGNYGTSLAALANCLYGGTITFIDNDEVIGYDVAIVELAATAVVDEVEDNYVSFKETAELFDGTSLDGILVDADDEEKIVKVTKDGEEIDIAELNEWDVLSVIAADYDANVVIAEVITNQVIGTIASTKKSNNSAEMVSGTPTAFKVDDTWYDVAVNRAGDALEIGVGGTFFVDKYGKIAAFQEDSALAGGAATNYGYILGVTVDTAAAFGKAPVKVMLLTSEGNIEYMELKNNAKLDGAVIYTTAGTGSTTAEDAAVALGAYLDDWDANVATDDTYGIDAVADGYVVRYTKNSNGALSTINTADSASDPNYKFISKGGDAGEYDADLSKLEGTYIDADAIIFAIDATDAKDSKIVKVADFEDKNTYTAYQVYATNKADDNDIIVVDADDFTTAGATAGLAVIAGVGETVNDDDETVLALTYYVNGEEFEALTTADVYSDHESWITVGDIVKVKKTGDVVSDVAVVYDFAESVRNADFTYDDTVAMAYSLNTDEEIAGGIATAYHKNSKLISFTDVDDVDGDTDDTETISYKLADNANKYVINFNVDAEPVVSTQGSYKYFSALYDPANAAETFEVKKGNTVIDASATVAEALELTDIVYVREYDGKVTDIVIIKGIDSCVKN